ncbi:MAG: lipocalin-like domain-containing protein [Tannerellaceae bacterium]|nr:lipocalin-like domain-containing protein [Tannerellaceae bacterium]
MKHLFLFFAAVFLFIACNKDTEDKLEGKWQLRQTELNGHVETVDTVFYNFLTSLFMYQIYQPVEDKYIEVYGHKQLEGDNRLIVDISETGGEWFLKNTDWLATEEHFTIESISGSRLILINTTTGKKYTFRKF